MPRNPVQDGTIGRTDSETGDCRDSAEFGLSTVGDEGVGDISPLTLYGLKLLDKCHQFILVVNTDDHLRVNTVEPVVKDASVLERGAVSCRRRTAGRHCPLLLKPREQRAEGSVSNLPRELPLSDSVFSLQKVLPEYYDLFGFHGVVL